MSVIIESLWGVLCVVIVAWSISVVMDLRAMRADSRKSRFRRLLRMRSKARRHGELRGIAQEQKRLAQRSINRRMVVGMVGDGISSVGRN